MLLAGIITFSASKTDEKEPETQQPQEYVATDASYNGFDFPTLAAQNQRPYPAPGTVHQGNDSTITRDIYYKDDQKRLMGNEITKLATQYSKVLYITNTKITAKNQRVKRILYLLIWG
ncbi:MAG: hypothetical protein R2750_12540 [Bacteroidales bacterium]